MTAVFRFWKMLQCPAFGDQSPTCHRKSKHLLIYDPWIEICKFVKDPSTIGIINHSSCQQLCDAIPSDPSYPSYRFFVGQSLRADEHGQCWIEEMGLSGEETSLWALCKYQGRKWNFSELSITAQCLQQGLFADFTDTLVIIVPGSTETLLNSILCSCGTKVSHSCFYVDLCKVCVSKN